MDIKKPRLTDSIAFRHTTENLLDSSFKDFRDTPEFKNLYARVTFTSHYLHEPEPLTRVWWVRHDYSLESTEASFRSLIHIWNTQQPKSYRYEFVKIEKSVDTLPPPFRLEHPNNTKPREIKVGRIYVMGTKELSYLIVVRKLDEREFVVLAYRGGFGVTIETQFEKLLMENSRLMTTMESCSVSIRHTLGPKARLLGIEPDYFDDFDNINDKTRDHKIH